MMRGTAQNTVKNGFRGKAIYSVLASSGAALKYAAFLFLGLAVAACSSSLYDDALETVPGGTAFQQALYRSYLNLATARDGQGADEQAEFYAAKALEAAGGVDVEPLAAIASVAETADARQRLTAAFNLGAKEAEPDMAAVAQTAYDCWVHEIAMDSGAAPAFECRGRFLSYISRLETALAPAPAPVAQAPQPANFTVYFGFDEWSLSAEALEVLNTVIETARAGGHGLIRAEGHTDTSGPASYNDGLSVRRAEIVKTVLVEMGALPEAIETIGYGETRPAVATGDGVREPLNRRTLVTLIP
ncbi:OmpA family protein [Tepidicaulis marinus]|nr:OmpA family protein [Tepidicaulis marinus]